MSMTLLLRTFCGIIFIYNCPIFSGFPVVNDPLYNHVVFGPEKGKGGRIGKSDEKLIEVQL